MGVEVEFHGERESKGEENILSESSSTKKVPRKFAFTRMCWYTDSPDADWIIDFYSEGHLNHSLEDSGTTNFKSTQKNSIGSYTITGPVPSIDTGLVIATSGTGHAFKFLPTIGSLVVSRIENSLGESERKRFGLVREVGRVRDRHRDGRKVEDLNSKPVEGSQSVEMVGV